MNAPNVLKALLLLALPLLGCATRARLSADRLFDECDQRGLSSEECHNHVGCAPETSRRRCRASLVHRLKFQTGEQGY